MHEALLVGLDKFIKERNVALEQQAANLLEIGYSLEQLTVVSYPDGRKQVLPKGIAAALSPEA